MTSDFDKTIVGGAEVFQAMQANDAKPLDDLHSIEAVLYTIKKLAEDITSLKELRKKRIKTIDLHIESVENQIEFLKTMIFATLKAHGERKVNFPGIGSVSQRKPRVSYKVTDEQALLKYLRQENEYDNIVEVPVDPIIKKHELNKLMGKWAKQGALPEFVDEVYSEQSVTVKLDSDTEVIEEYEDVVDELQGLDFSDDAL